MARIKLKELEKQIEKLKQYYNYSDNSEIILRINEDREYLIISDNGLEVIIKVN